MGAFDLWILTFNTNPWAMSSLVKKRWKLEIPSDESYFLFLICLFTFVSLFIDIWIYVWLYTIFVWNYIDSLNFYSESWFKFPFSCWMAAIVLSNFCAKVWLGSFFGSGRISGISWISILSMFALFTTSCQPLCRHPLAKRRLAFVSGNFQICIVPL